MGDNLGPNGMSRGCKVLCSKSKLLASLAPSGHYHTKWLHAGTLRHATPARVLDHDVKVTGANLALDGARYDVAGEFERTRDCPGGLISSDGIILHQQARSPKRSSLGTTYSDHVLTGNRWFAI